MEHSTQRVLSSSLVLLEKKEEKKASVKVKVFSRCVGGTQRLTPEGGTVAVNRRKPSAGPGSPVDDQRVTQKEIQLSEH